MPSVQALVTAFNSGADARSLQDVGIDGMDDEMEREFIATEAGEVVSYLDRIQNKYGPTSDAYLNANDDPLQITITFFMEMIMMLSKKEFLGVIKNIMVQREFTNQTKQYLHILNFQILKILIMILP